MKLAKKVKELKSLKENKGKIVLIRIRNIFNSNRRRCNIIKPIIWTKGNMFWRKCMQSRNAS